MSQSLPEHESILEANSTSVWNAYLQAKDGGASHPVIVLCSLEVYRFLRPEDADPELPTVQAVADRLNMESVALVIEDHEHLYQGLCNRSCRAALDLGATPDASHPFVVVVMTRSGVSVMRPSEVSVARPSGPG